MQWLTLVVLTLVVLAPSAPAFADQSYHSTHAPLLTAGGAVTQGSVVNIHPNGPVLGAIERYHIVGATPNTSYCVYWEVVGFGIIPSGLDFAHPFQLTTNTAGNATGQLQIPRSFQLANGFTDTTITVRWLIRNCATNELAFRTEFAAVHLD